MEATNWIISHEFDMPHMVATGDSWAHIKNELTRFEAGWVFRGQRDAQWSLKTSLDRTREVWKIDPQQWEKYLYHNFRRRLGEIVGQHPMPTLPLDTLALMQHYGIPTRLLDWTRSPFVAAYFAIENAIFEPSKDDLSPQYASIWAVHLPTLQRNSARHFKDTIFADFARPNVADERYFEMILDRALPGIFYVEPYSQNERIAAQKGLFLASGRVDRSFEANLADTVDAACIRCIAVPLTNQVLRESLMDLFDMNISRASLFPGMDGFAQSLRSETLAQWFKDAHLQHLPGLTSKQSNYSSNK